MLCCLTLSICDIGLYYMCVCREGKTPRTRDGKTLKWKRSLPCSAGTDFRDRITIMNFMQEILTVPTVSNAT